MISQRALAKHLGVTPMVVHNAIKKGKLVACVLKDEAGKPLGLTSLEEAAAEWRRVTDYTDAPQRDPGVRAATANAPEGMGPVERKNHYEAELKLVKLRETAGELVDAAAVKKKQTETYAHVRSRLLGIPTSLKQMAPETPVSTVQIVERLVFDALKELSA